MAKNKLSDEKVVVMQAFHFFSRLEYLKSIQLLTGIFSTIVISRKYGLWPWLATLRFEPTPSL